MYAVLLRLLAASLLFVAVAAAPRTIRAGSWNVYYHALDDTLGRAAIIDTIDNADAAAPFDFFGVVEAQGDTSHGP